MPLYEVLILSGPWSW